MTWTPELIDRLKAEYRTTGNAMFAIRYGLSRGQVSGMAYRLGLSVGGVPIVRKRKPKAEQKEATTATVTPATKRADLLAEHHATDVTTDPRYSCAWPLEGSGQAMTSCGEPVQVKNGRRSPYCCKHHQRAHQ